MCVLTVSCMLLLYLQSYWILLWSPLISAVFQRIRWTGKIQQLQEKNAGKCLGKQFLFRNRVPETGRAAGREARSVPASFPFESPCGISFRTVRKSEREPVRCSAAPGRLPHRGWRRVALGCWSRRARGGAGGPGASPTGWGWKLLRTRAVPGTNSKQFRLYR